MYIFYHARNHESISFAGRLIKMIPFGCLLMIRLIRRDKNFLSTNKLYAFSIVNFEFKLCKLGKLPKGVTRNCLVELHERERLVYFRVMLG